MFERRRYQSMQVSTVMLPKRANVWLKKFGYCTLLKADWVEYEAINFLSICILSESYHFLQILIKIDVLLFDIPFELQFNHPIYHNYILFHTCSIVSIQH